MVALFTRGVILEVLSSILQIANNASPVIKLNNNGLLRTEREVVL
jgi:hypothetical protein